MIKKVKNTIEKYGLLENGDRVTVGLSGGADSMALMSVLSSLRDEYNLSLCAVHINHGIRGEEAKRDENFVKAFCEKNDIELFVFHKDIPSLSEENGESEEECGRRVRYECFSEVSDDGKIATAHTLSDSTETMIFNMLRGSSAKGLCSIPAKRDNIIRPLIDCTREEIEKYCKEKNLDFVTDSTNLSSDYTRNYIRLEILPMFSRVNPSYTATLSRLRTYISEDNAYLDKEAKRLMNAAMKGETLDVSLLLNEDNVLIRRVLVFFIKSKTGISPESRHIELLLEKISGEFTLQLSDDYYVCIRSGKIFIEKKNKFVVTNGESIPLNTGKNTFCEITFTAEIISGKEFFNNYYNLLENAIDCDRIKGSVSVRSRREGDRFYFHKRKITKTLKKLFCEMKIPQEKRSLIPVICDEEKVLWVSGVGTDGNCRVTPETENVLIIKEE